MLLKPGRRPEGVLSDFAKAIKTELAKDTHIGPAYSRAPEVNGVDYYTNAIDIWSSGQAFANIIIRKSYNMPDVYAFIGETRQLTVPELKDHLDHLAGLSNNLYSPFVSIVKDMLTHKSRRPSIDIVATRWSVLVSPQALLMYDNTFSSTRHGKPFLPYAPSRGIASQPPMAPSRVIRRVKRPAYSTSVAGIDQYVNPFESAQRGKEIGNFMRIGGGSFTPINRPPRSPNLKARGHGGESPLAPFFDVAADRASRTGYKVPTLQLLPEADEEAVRAPGTGAKRTWEDRDSEDAGPEAKAAKLG